MYILFVDM